MMRLNTCSKLFILTVIFLLFLPTLTVLQTQSAEHFKDLIGTSWKAVKIDNISISKHHPTLDFDKRLPQTNRKLEKDKNVAENLKDILEGDVFGNAPCNMFGGAFKSEGQSLRFFSIRSTLMLCSTQENKIEEKFLEVLRHVTSWRYENGNLFLIAEKKDRRIQFIQIHSDKEIE